MANPTVTVKLVADASKYVSELQRAAKKSKGLAKEATGIKDRFKALGPAAKASLAAAGVALIKFGQDSIRAATDLNESVNAVNKVFGDASASVLSFAGNAAQATGLAASQFNQLAAQTGAGLRNFGLSAQSAATESIKLTTRAADLASIFNTDVNDALLAVQAGLRGETEPLRRFGVSLDDATLRAKAVELGLAETTSEVDRNAKAVAALEVIYEQTNNAAGDFAQTSGDLANAQRIAAAEWENAQAAFGQAAIPVATSAVNAFTTTLLSFRTIAGDAVAEGSLRVRENLAAINDAVGTDKLIRFQDALFNVAGVIDLTAGEVLAFANAAEVSNVDVDVFTESLRSLGESSGKSEEEIQEVIDAVNAAYGPLELTGDAAGDLGEELDGVAEASKRAKKSQKELADELRSQADPVFGAARAFADYQKVLEEIDEDGERTAEELLKLAEASIESQEALAGLGGGNLVAGIDAIGTALGISREEARNLLEELGLLDGYTVTSTVDLRVNVPRDLGGPAASAISGGLANLTRTSREISSGRQHGGPVSAATPYLVGEAGPELFIPSSSGRIVNSAATGQMAAGPTINVQVTVPTGDPVEIQAGVQRGLYEAGIVELL